MDSPYFNLVRCIDKCVAIVMPRTMPQHSQRFIHANNGGLAHAAREPLHLHFNVAHGYLFR